MQLDFHWKDLVGCHGHSQYNYRCIFLWKLAVRVWSMPCLLCKWGKDRNKLLKERSKLTCLRLICSIIDVPHDLWIREILLINGSGKFSIYHVAADVEGTKLHRRSQPPFYINHAQTTYTWWKYKNFMSGQLKCLWKHKKLHE